MNILKYGMPWVLIGELIYMITRDKELKKKIEKTKEWKKIQSIGKEVVALNNDLVEKVKAIKYDKQVDALKKQVAAKEKDLQNHIKKLETYKDTIGERKVNDIIQDMKQSFATARNHINGRIQEIRSDIAQDMADIQKKKAAPKKTSTRKTVKKAPAKKVASKKAPTPKKKTPAKKSTPKKTTKKTPTKK